MNCIWSGYHIVPVVLITKRLSQNKSHQTSTGPMEQVAAKRNQKTTKHGGNGGTRKEAKEQRINKHLACVSPLACHSRCKERNAKRSPTPITRIACERNQESRARSQWDSENARDRIEKAKVGADETGRHGWGTSRKQWPRTAHLVEDF